jgi:hypothetical protein
MNGGGFWPTGKLLRFNGGLFAEQGTLPLATAARRCSSRATGGPTSSRQFRDVLERALDRASATRSARTSPRAYVGGR